MNRQLREEACRILATSGSGRVWVGERHHVFVPFRMEGALQLDDAQTEAGFCVCLSPLPTDWGGANRPPIVLFAYCSTAGLHIARSTESEPEVLGHLPCSDVEVNVPLLCIVELRGPPLSLRLTLGAGGQELAYTLDEEVAQEVLIWAMGKQGQVTFFDVALTDLSEAGTGGEQTEADADSANGSSSICRSQ